MVIKTRDIEKALLAKGFVENRKSHHIFFYFKYKGKIIKGVLTKISHSASEYGDSLLNAMKRQLKFERLNDLYEFIGCTITEEMYINMLKEKGILKFSESSHND